MATTPLTAEHILRVAVENGQENIGTLICQCTGLMWDEPSRLMTMTYNSHALHHAARQQIEAIRDVFEEALGLENIVVQAVMTP